MNAEPSLRQYVLTLVNAGFRVFPLRWQSKTPAIEKWQFNATTELDQVHDWLDSNRYTGFGVVCDDFIVVDVDSKLHGSGKKNGIQEWKDLIADKTPEEMGKVTLSVKTPSGGYHFYYQRPDNDSKFVKGADKLAPGIDIQTGKAYVVAPGTYVVDHEKPEKSGTYKAVILKRIQVLPSWIEEVIKQKYVAPSMTDIPRPPIYNEDVVRAIKAILRKLDNLTKRGWNGLPWDQTTFNCACSLVEIANNPFNDYPLSIAHKDFLKHAPVDQGFDSDRHEEKWNSALQFIGDKSRSFDKAGEVEYDPESPEERWKKLTEKTEFVNTEDLMETLTTFVSARDTSAVPDGEMDAIFEKLQGPLSKVDTAEKASKWLNVAKELVKRRVDKYGGDRATFD